MPPSGYSEIVNLYETYLLKRSVIAIAASRSLSRHVFMCDALGHLMPPKGQSQNLMIKSVDEKGIDMVYRCSMRAEWGSYHHCSEVGGCRSSRCVAEV
jgi:hypothetical protein